MESLSYCIFGILGLASCLFVTAFLGLLGGGMTLLISRLRGIRNQPLWTWLSIGVMVISGIVLLAITGARWGLEGAASEFTSQSATLAASYTPQYFNWDNQEMQPFILALDAVDREALGFTPIPPYARVEMDWTVPPAQHDVMLHIYADTSRTVAFRREDDGYVWLGEQEIHAGPNRYHSADGDFYEQIVVTYETMYLSGAPLNTIYITYYGNDPRLRRRHNLTLEDIQPVLEEWREVQLRPTPSSW